MIISSHISGITLLGIPSEIYEFGTQYLATVLSTVIIVLVTNNFFLPVFYDLQLYSLYEVIFFNFFYVLVSNYEIYEQPTPHVDASLFEK